MSTASCCLPTVIPTRATWHRRAWESVAEALVQAHRRWRRQAQHARCVAAMRGLPASTLHDIGLTECVHDAPTLPRTDWEFGRWR